jgi:hypothetical protein
MKNFKIGDMVGLTVENIVVTGSDDEMTFTFTNGIKVKFYHSQECCENVYIESIVGDINDLIGNVLTVAEEVSNYDYDTTESKLSKNYVDWGDVEQWTFYKFDSNKGGITVRWYGTSNGYYSTGVYMKVEL